MIFHNRSLAQHTTRYFCLIIILISLLGFATNASSQTEATHDELLHFEAMATYLTKDSGKWTGINKQYDASKPNSPKAYGLWFERPLKNLLTLKIVAYIGDSTRISSEGIFSWHPVKQKFVHITADRGNGYAEGHSSFPNDSSFISTMIIYRPDGKFYHHKDENFIQDENTHSNISYTKDASGTWVEQGRWTWKRDPENKP